ncbi:hypothetical protein [Burkholderia glumae]|uniref:hypothetical protein n=1 Tax=Burkholderia glumae TaxID=337 RepID=UPI002150D638|nr:hypothetical protein [Burkholderia glumae]
MKQTTNKQPDQKLWRPFLRLAKYLSDEFLSRSEEWLFLVSEYGISKTPTRPTTKEEWLQFYAHCHDGWKKAQAQIAEFLTDAVRRRVEAKANEKQQHRLKDKEGCKQAHEEVRRINLEITFARRILDVILWTIFAGEHSTLRRLVVDGGEHSLSAENIAVAMRVADEVNKDPLVMALSTDMLSLVHVGDLIVTNRESGSIKFVELKAGEKNIEIAKTVEFAVRSECEMFEALATAKYDEADKKQYERVKRQAKRNKMIVSTIQDERGTDPNTGSEVIIQATREPPEFWTERIQRCYEKLTDEKKWAIDVIDGCVYLGVYSDQFSAFVGFNAWMAQIGCESKIYNLMDSFHDLLARPLGAVHLESDLRTKIFRGDILVIMCLDIRKFIELGNEMNPNGMRLATKAETAQMKPHRLGNFTLDGRYIVMEIDGEVMYMGAGTRDRILFDQHYPSQLLAYRLAAGPLSQYSKEGSAGEERSSGAE